jgi:hypothetical protein
LTLDDLAHQWMQRRDGFAQMLPEKFKRHFYCEKLMPLVGLTRVARKGCSPRL